ncbi:hypothetical protein BH11MYX2_BH11MYX2_08200 [soil metagenome]
MAMLVIASRAARADAPEHIRVTYDAPAGCGTADEFFAQLAARVAVVRDDADAARRLFAVTITQGADRVDGALTIRGTDTSVRAVQGATCDETISALAVVAALAVTDERPPPEPPRVLSPPPPPHTDQWLAAGAGIAENIGVVPDAVLGLSAFVSYGRAHTWQIRLEIARTSQQDAVIAAGTSQFRWTAGRLEVRPFAFTAGPLDVAPAVGVEVGAVTAHGTTVNAPMGGSRPWIAPRAVGRGTLHLGRFALELEGGVAFPLIRDRYFVGPDMTLFEVPAVAFAAQLAVSVQIL